MAKSSWVLLEEFHLDILITANLKAPAVRSARIFLNSRRVRRELLTAFRRVLQCNPVLRISRTRLSV